MKVDSRVEKHRKQKKKRKWIYWVLGIGFGLLLLVGGYLFYLYNQVGSTVDVMHEPLERDGDPSRLKEIDGLLNDGKAVNFLLLGVDERQGDRGRSDTIIFLSLNPQTDSMLMLSIPRDTYVNIPGHGMDKVNHAYAYGDVELSVQTVEDTLDVPIHFYSRVNMEGFQQGIDAIGGVTVQNDRAFNQDGEHFPEGEIRLNGEQALKYIRMRKEDPRGDLGRNERQREVVTAAINEAASVTSITKIGDILSILGGNVKTDLQMDHMQTLVTNYLGTRNNMKTIEFNGNGQNIGGVYYYVVPDEDMNRVQTEIKNHMNGS
ncbi:LCP family glycopolymer transferase [Oceanobacillus halotolerans]|uniref:LCP family glycopolymer transferase n=1 Tax=Oceanobacillus halotolerans TaxID=2663380 RepID=UPI00299F2975|nr:LCP family protein [Oceanobacillus halotolerans]